MCVGPGVYGGAGDQTTCGARAGVAGGRRAGLLDGLPFGADRERHAELRPPGAHDLGRHSGGRRDGARWGGWRARPAGPAVRAGGPRRGVIVGAPDYFARHPKPRHPRDLKDHNCIRRRFASGRLYRWELEKDGRAQSVSVTGNLILPQQDLIRRAALQGLGLAFLFKDVVAGDLRDGRLTAVLDDWCPPFEGFYIYYPSRRQMRPALRAFIDFFRC